MKNTSNKTKYWQVEKKLNSLTSKGYNVLIGRLYFIGDDRSQDLFVYQSILDTLELQKTRVLIMFLVGNQRWHIVLNLSHYILISCIA